ncbi:SprT-like domain-containing protein [Halomonas qinghailakensis]|uniref:SprT-like domain-containing protein n=1 Tax=Halomonas qinghailakensis TaxID=2937790 RepID=A0AA46TN60_9GAMM|nr:MULTISPECIES: SprT-like domain-containing protein [Halomonas]UYO73414.1 SprT-like domain-containing protein [Halomonas sp. ZZQ-149]
MKTLPLPPWPAEKLAMLSSEALKHAVRERADEALKRCQEVYPTLPAPMLWFDLTGASAGQAHLGRGGLRFNLVLLSNNRQAFFDEVIPHEMAHWLVFHLANGARFKPHGREWQVVMRDLFGLTPKVTHHFDIKEAQSRPYYYQCGCQTHRFTARRHALVAKGSRYRCRHCDQTLVYSSFEKA